MADAPRTPAQVAVYVEALGEEDAIDFLLRFGGADLTIPKSPHFRTELRQALGQRKTEALCAVRDRIPKRIPTAKPWIAQRLRAKNLPVSAIARKLHVSDVSVRRWLNQRGMSGRADPRQGTLF